jgi:LPXTG-motif cell wall-anchored protein
MKMLAAFVFLIGFAGLAWAGVSAPAPAPEMSAGILGMTLAAGGAIYLIKRRNRD